MGKHGILNPRELAREIARRLPRFNPLEKDPKRQVTVWDEWDSPWEDPNVQYGLGRLPPRALAEVLRLISNEIDPPQKKSGPHVSGIEEHRRATAELRLRVARLMCARARSGSGYASRNPRICEALALRLDANETAAVLAFASMTGVTGPLADVDVDVAVRYFNTARKGKKPRGFVPRKPKPKGGPLRRKEPQRCPDAATPTAPAEPASPSTPRPSSSARPTSRASSASPKGTYVRSKPATPPRPARSRSAAPYSGTSTRGSRSSATRPRPKRRRKDPDGS